MQIFWVVAIILALTVIMIMSGRGGGNSYVAALVLLGVPMHTASTTSQFILLAGALAGALVFGKARTMSRPLAIFFGGPNASTAFAGGFMAHSLGATQLKIILSVLLFVAGIAMVFPEIQVDKTAVFRLGYWNIRAGAACM
jgi:hypothetical protein